MTQNSTLEISASHAPALARTLTIGQATGLAVTIVVGSGLLALPGLAYQQSAASAVYAWALSALLSLPLLVIFASLGSRFPSASGISGFVETAFGRTAAAATEAMLLGTFVFGGTAIALTGGQYAAAAFGGGDLGAAIATFAFLLLATLVNLQGVRVSGRIQQFLALALLAILFFVAVSALLLREPGAGVGVAPIEQWYQAVPSIGMVFFAFTGWELLSFTAEEFRNPRRDLPLSIMLSFVIVVTLYLTIAVAVQLTLPPHSATSGSAPFSAMLGTLFGPLSARLVAAVGLVIIAANLIGGSWAASRLVFASARAGLLPQALGKISSRTQVPQQAVIALMLAFAIMTLLHAAKLLPFQLFFQLAGQNFLLLYGLSVMAYIRLASSWAGRVFGACTLALVLATAGTFGLTILYPLGLLAIGAIWSRARAAVLAPL